MDVNQIEVGMQYRVRTPHGDEIVTVLHETKTRSPAWRCELGNGTPVIVALSDFIAFFDKPILPKATPRVERVAAAPIQVVPSPPSVSSIVRGKIYRVRKGFHEVDVEVIHPSLSSPRCWVVREFITGPIFTIDEDDIIPNAEG